MYIKINEMMTNKKQKKNKKTKTSFKIIKIDEEEDIVKLLLFNNFASCIVFK